MNDEVKEALFIYCLDELEAGVPAAEILARYPEHADEIRPLLEMATQLAAFTPEPPPRAQAQAQDLFLAHARAMKQAGRRPRMSVGSWRRLALALGAAVLLFVAFLVASEETASALPGSAFYPVKRAAEDLQLRLTRNDEIKERLTQQFADKRVREINNLLAINGEAEVECHGRISEIGAEIWTICGLPVVVNEETLIEGAPFVGGEVIVQGVTRDGRFIAIRIFMVPGQVMPFIATPLPSSPTPTLKDSPTPLLPVTPRPSPDPEPEETEEPEETREPEKTEEPEESEEPEEEDDDKTRTPEPDDDDDNSGPGGGDDNNSGSGSGNSGSGGGDDDNSGPGSGNGGG